jgi:hypothetical protein
MLRKMTTVIPCFAALAALAVLVVVGLVSCSPRTIAPGATPTLP